MRDEPRVVESSAERRGGVRNEQTFASTASSVTAKVFELAGRRTASPDDLRLDASVREVVEGPLQALGYELVDRTLSLGAKSLQCTMADGEHPFCLMYFPRSLLPAEDGERPVHDFSYLGFFLKGQAETHPLRLISEDRETLPIDFDNYLFVWKQTVGLDARFVGWSRVEALRDDPNAAAAVLIRLGLDFVVDPAARPQPEREADDDEPLGEVVDINRGAAPAEDDDEAPQDRPGVFISYSHQDDAKWIRLVRTYLAPLKRLGYQVWDDSHIEPGQRWAELIAAELARARVVVLLVSQNFENSEFILNNELRPALDNAEGGVLVFPVALSYVVHDQDPMKSLLMDYQWAYGPPTETLAAIDGLTDAEVAVALGKVRRAVQLALEDEG